jgi:bacterioferritin (cytochrome b1)
LTAFNLANRLAERIARLGGHPGSALLALDQTGLDHADTPASIDERILKDLAAERAAANLHRKLLVRLGIGDPGTSALLRELLLVDEEQLNSLTELRWSRQAPQDDYSGRSGVGGAA